MTLDKLYKFSVRSYLIILGLTIPIYLLLYGASGHEFNVPPEDLIWIVTVIGALVLMTLYLIQSKKEGLGYNTIRILLGLILVVTFYGGLKAFLFIYKFKFGDDVGFFIRGLSYTVPLLLSASSIIIFIELIKRK